MLFLVRCPSHFYGSLFLWVPLLGPSIVTTNLTDAFHRLCGLILLKNNILQENNQIERCTTYNPEFCAKSIPALLLSCLVSTFSLKQRRNAGIEVVTLWTKYYLYKNSEFRLQEKIFNKTNETRIRVCYKSLGTN